MATTAGRWGKSGPVTDTLPAGFELGELWVDLVVPL